MAVAATASFGANAEQIVAASHHGEIQTIDTVTGELLNEFYMSTPDGTGPAGVTFKNAEEMLVTVSVGFGGEKVFQFHSAGGASWSEGLKFVQGRFDDPMFSTPAAIVQAGPQGIAYAVGSASHDLWAFAGTRSDRQGNLYLAGNRVMRFSQQTPSLMFTRDIAASRLDSRIAVAGSAGIRILNNGAVERDITITGYADGLAFDPFGREVNGEKHSLLYVIAAPGDSVRVYRYDAVTGEPWGADPNNRSNPIFIAPGTGGLANYCSDIHIDQITGDIYIAASSNHRTDQFGYPWNCLNRFDKDGNPKGLITDRENSAVMRSFINGSDITLAIRPRYDVREFSNNGSFTLTPDMVGFGLAGLNFIGDNDGAVIRLAGAEGPAIKVGGDESGAIQVDVPAGANVALQSLILAAKSMFNLEEGARLNATQVALFASSYLHLTLASILDVGVDQPFLAESGSKVGGVGKIITGIGAIIRGVLSPGQSPGKLTIEGNLALTTESNLEIELAGTEQGVTYDHLDVRNGAEGFVALRGKLSVKTLSGFATSANEFNILTAESPIVAGFNNVADGRVLTADGRGTFAVRLVNDGKTLQLADYQPFAGTPYEAWLQLNFTATERADVAVSGPNADPDNDGLSNLMEFAFNANPKLAAAVNTTTALNAAAPNIAAIEFLRRAGGTGTAANYIADGIRYEILQSADLTTWTPLSDTLVAQSQTRTNEDGATETLRINIPNGQPTAFFRLRVTAE